MSAAILKDLYIELAKAFKQQISNTGGDQNIYLVFGKPTPWSNEASPDVANTSYAQSFDVWKNAYGGKKISGNDVHHVTKRFNWEAGVSFAEFDFTHAYNPNTRFYVVTSGYNVYKCISNNNGAISTIEPSSLSTTNITNTSDGYIWKYMYSITDDEQIRFTTEEYMPVKTLSVDDGSAQWDVQQNAVDGALYHITLTNTGSGYTNASNIILTISGDGSGAAGNVRINNISNTVNSIVMTSYGSGYTFADVTISGGGGSGATGRALIGPSKGHGYDPVSELNGAVLIVNPRVENTEDGVLCITNDVRQIALVSNPYVYTTTNLMTNTAFSQSLDLTMSGYGPDYEADEIVYQGDSYENRTFSAKILEWDSASLTLKLINTVGTLNAAILYGANSTTAKFVASIDSYPDCVPYSGRVLLVENIEAIQRDITQTESYKIIIRFDAAN